MMVFVQLQLNRGKGGEADLLPEGEKMFFLIVRYTLQWSIRDGFVKKTAVEGIKSSLLSQDYNISSSFLRKCTFSRGNQSPRGVTSNNVLLELPFKNKDFDKSSHVKL